MIRWAQLPEFSSLPAEWEIKPLPDVADFIAGQSPDSEHYNESGDGLPFLQGAAEFGFRFPSFSIYSRVGVKIAPAGSTIISVRAPVGEVNEADREYVIGRGVGALVASKLDAHFLFHGMQRWKMCLARVGQGTTFDAVTARQFNQLQVPVPPPDEQAVIARILDAADTAIERARVAVEKAERVKTSLLQRVFGGSASPRRISEFCRDACYGTSQASNDRGWGYPTLRIPNVIGGDFNSSNLTFVDMGEASAKALALQSGDTLVVRTNGNPAYVGRAAVFYPPDGRIWLFASYLIRLRFSADLSPDYFQEFINSSFGRRELHQRVATSAGNYNLNIRNLRSIRIPWIEPDHQTEAVKLLRAANQTIRATETRVSALERLKRGLMQDLLTGRVRVKTAAASSLAATV